MKEKNLKKKVYCIFFATMEPTMLPTSENTSPSQNIGIRKNSKKYRSKLPENADTTMVAGDMLVMSKMIPKTTNGISIETRAYQYVSQPARKLPSSRPRRTRRKPTMNAPTNHEMLAGNDKNAP